jgi:hypothetical protein
VFVLAPWLAATLCAAAPQPALDFTKLDDFEDASAWLKGDPKTDLEQKDAAVAASTEVVHGGKQSLAFLIRVNWTPRPNEKYPKGWPMVSRKFDAPRDWSGYDYVCFWLYARTDAKLLQERVLRVGFPTPQGKETEWYTIPGIEPNRWQEVVVPLTMPLDWARVTGITFYVAEAWYNDGDKVDFYLDDMRLAKRTAPAFSACSVTSRVFPRGQAVGVFLRVEGPQAGARLRCRLTNRHGKEQGDFTEPLTAKEQQFAFPAKGLPAGEHYAALDLLDKSGTVVDSQRKYFRSLLPGKRSYLKLITFYTKPLQEADAASLGVLNDSAYAGVAIPLKGSYDTDPVPEYESLAPKLKLVRDALTIDPWPWVAMNRFIGAPTDREGHASSHAGSLDYFLRIKGLDLGNEAGARADMLKLWRHAVRAAREWRSPGIMIDLEAYNDYRVYHVPYVAQQRGETLDQVIQGCEQLGADLGKIIAEEYPQCVVWSLFSRLEATFAAPGRKDPIYTTPSYVTLGLLKYAKQNNVPLKYLCGGETTPGYCNKSLDDLKRKIADRDAAVAPFLEAFGDRFDLAGTISPLHDYSLATGWIQQGYADSPFQTLQDFEPLFRTLFDAYDWNWIYASSAAKTLPYKPENNRLYGEVLRKALDDSVKGT